MKRALLIAGGTVGGLGAVLAITPPQLGSTSAINIAGAPTAGASSGTAEVTPASSSSATAVATKAAKPAVTKKAGAAASSAATTAPTAAATAEATTAAINGTFTGPSVNVNYGNVQVKITVANGRITDAVAVKAPTGRNDRWTNMAVPILKEQTLAAQSANIQGASGASYTSYGWHTSLQGALAQAGL
jgi:uncharacterized protein with FMN-binding domain